MHCSAIQDAAQCSPQGGVASAHLKSSFAHATLDTGDWLGLTRQGLSPCKKCQALPGARNCCKTISQVRIVARLSEERSFASFRHFPRGTRDRNPVPRPAGFIASWIPAFAGMTTGVHRISTTSVTRFRPASTFCNSLVRQAKLGISYKVKVLVG